MTTVVGPRPGLDDLHAVILLAGAVRPSPLYATIGRSVLDLPFGGGRTLLDLWRRQASELAHVLGRDDLTVRVAIDRSAHAPVLTQPAHADHVSLRVERDPHDFRGAGGLLRDLVAGYPEDALVLVASATQLPITPLASLASDLAVGAAGTNILTHADDSPAGLMLVRCGCLRVIPEVGFIDFKEQALPAIGEEFPVRVVRRDRSTGPVIHSPADYIDALRAHHLGPARAGVLEDPFAERWEPVFALIEEGADVARSARLQDSVVLRGAVVDEDAVVIRSVVCPGAVVRRGSYVIDDLVSSTARSRR